MRIKTFTESSCKYSKVRLTLLLMLTAVQASFAQAPFPSWSTPYNGPGMGKDLVVKNRSDAGGNVYVLVNSDGDTGPGENYDVAVVKYNTSGGQMWATRFNGPGNGNDYGKDIAVDEAGNVYVTATAYVVGKADDYESIKFDIATIKYNSAGVQQWVKYYDAETMEDQPRALTVDASGNVYVVGYSAQKDTMDLPWEYYIYENRDFTTIKYNPSGVQQWVRHFGTTGSGYDSYTKGPDVATHVAVDGSSNIYVAGHNPTASGGEKCVLIKYSESGVMQWNRYTASGVGSHIGGLSLDASDNPVLAANYYPGAGDDYLDVFRFYVEKYSPTGNLIWSNHVDNNGEWSSLDDGDTKAGQVLLDKSGNVYVAGTRYVNEPITSPDGYGYVHAPNKSDFFVIKFNATGVIQWQTIHLKKTMEAVMSSVIDAAGSVYVSGTSVDTTGYTTCTTAKFNTNGTVAWAMETNSDQDNAKLSVAPGLTSSSFVLSTSYVGSIGGLQVTTTKYGQDSASDAPTIASFMPTAAPIGAGIAIRGTNFSASTTIHINGRVATNVSYEGPNLIIATVPPGTTSGRIHVVNPNGSAVSDIPLIVGSGTSPWEPKSTMATARTQHGAVAISSNGKVYAFGGTNGTELASLEVYTTNSFAWAAGAPIPTATRGAGSVRGTDNMIYVMSGYGGGANRKQCYRYNPATNAWTTLAQAPNAVWAPMTAAKGNFIYLFGGQNASNAVSNLVQIYNSQTNTWSIGAPMPAGLMQGQAITSYNGKIYIFGGRTAASGGLSDVVRVYNPDNNTWSTAAPMMIPKAQFAAVLNNDGRIYIVGGRGSYQPNVGPFFHSVEIYNPSNNTWDWGPDLPSAVGGTTLVNSNGNLFLMGGIDGSYRNYNWRLVLPPVAPTTSKATATSSTQIKVEWHDASGNENRFEVERSQLANGPWTAIATTAANVNTYTNTGRAANTTYFYRVRPANSSGYGPYGPVVSAKTWATGASAREAVEEAITVLNLQSAPNPFSGLGKVSFVAQETGRATVLLFDLQGNQVQQIFDNDVEKGEPQMGEVNGSSLLGGMYLLRVVNGSHSESIKLILNK